MAKIRYFVLTALLCFAPFHTEIQAQATAMPEAVSDYSRALDVIRKSAHSNADIERLLALGRKAADVLVMSKAPGSPAMLESLTDNSFQALVHAMEGFWVNRQEVVYVEPDPAFFLALAKVSGDQASVEFFEAFGKTFENAWPVYHERQTDYGGCVRFGSLSLVKSYSMWNNYRAKHPKRYSGEVENILKNLEQELAKGTCACGGKETAIKEFQAFIRAFPRSSLAKRIRERLDQIEKGTTDIRWGCIPG